MELVPTELSFVREAANKWGRPFREAIRRGTDYVASLSSTDVAALGRVADQLRRTEGARRIYANMAKASGGLVLSAEQTSILGLLGLLDELGLVYTDIQEWVLSMSYPTPSHVEEALAAMPTYAGRDEAGCIVLKGRDGGTLRAQLEPGHLHLWFPPTPKSYDLAEDVAEAMGGAFQVTCFQETFSELAERPDES